MQEKKVCRHCGVELGEGMAFCLRCGRPVGGASESGSPGIKWLWMLGMAALVCLIFCGGLYALFTASLNNMASSLRQEMNAPVGTSSATADVLSPTPTPAGKTETELAYETKLKKAVADISENGNKTVDLLIETYQELHDAAYKQTVIDYFSSSDYLAKKSELTKNNAEIEQEMSALKNPPERYMELYIDLVNLYVDYRGLYLDVLYPLPIVDSEQELRKQESAFRKEALTLTAKVSVLGQQ